MRRSKRRWGDNDKHFGPLTLAWRETWRPLAIILSSGGGDDDHGCCVRLQAFGATLICELPPVVKPWRHWVDTSRWPENPQGGYWHMHPREYGFVLSDGHLSLSLGVQTMDSSTEQRWGCFLPWTQWRQIAHRLYGAELEPVADIADVDWDERRRQIDALPKREFVIEDFDGERIIATTYVEEREWRRGTGWFRWLGFIVPKRVRRSLDIRFSAEVGPEKGSWKGGMIGTGAEMIRGETHEQAFHRFCDNEHRSKYRKYRIRFVEALT